MTLEQLLQRLQKANFEKDSLKVIQDNDQKAIDYNVDDQLFERGITATGKAVGEYSMLTKKIKAAKNQRYDHVTLRDTTNFHDSFFLQADRFPLMLDARDWKKSKLIEKYGNDIFGLTDENKGKFAKDILPDLQKAARAIFGI